MTMNSKARSSPNSRYAQRRMDMMLLVAAMPLFAINTRRMTRVPPFAATYSANLSCFVSAVTGAGSATAALSFVSQFLAPFCCGATSAFLCGARGASGPVNACAVASKAKAMLSRAIFAR